MCHDLVIIYKGYRQQANLHEARAAFGRIEHKGLELPDTGFDIGAYFECAKQLSNRHMVFLNTHSEIGGEGWLAALYRHGQEDGVGIAGAMASYESLNDTVEILQDVLLKCAEAGNDYDPGLAYYFDFLLRRHHPSWYAPNGEVLYRRAKTRGRIRKLAARGARHIYQAWLVLRGTSLIWPGAPRFDVGQFPRFPNPHIRSNAFMVRRDRWLKLVFKPSRKVDTSLFESGPKSLTARLRSGGLATLVVGRDGRGYDIQEWPISRTFRLGDQANLIVHDNHTRAFEGMSYGARMAHAWMTWGNALGQMPPDFPKLPFSLAADPFTLRRQPSERGIPEYN
jgi:hypothetical protein